MDDREFENLRQTDLRRSSINADPWSSRLAVDVGRNRVEAEERSVEV